MDKEVMMEQNKDVQKGTQTNSLGKKKKTHQPLGYKTIVNYGNNINMTKYSQLLIFAL